MIDDLFERLRALNPDVIESAKAVATGAVAAMPNDLKPTEEPAHVYMAVVPGADDAEPMA
ncbi:MAG: hypothetical protein ACI9DC_002111 [Gammaproteobacteria bacterium]|jgi:hypothetical protein